MSGIHDCGGDAAAYALGALDPGEVEAFREHLASCAVCRDELVSLQQIADALPMAAPQHPVPRSVRKRVLGQARAESRRVPAASRDRPRRWMASGPRLAVLSSGVLAASLAAVGGVEIASSGGPSSTSVFASTVGHAELKLSSGHAELFVHRLPLPAAGRIYEVWLKRPDAAPAPTSALFSVTRTGSGTVDVPGDLHGVSQVMVTQEPAGGSLVPTTAPVIVTPLS